MDQHAGTTLTPYLCADGIDAIQAPPALNWVLCHPSGPGAEHQTLIQVLLPVCGRRTSGATRDRWGLAPEHHRLGRPHAAQLALQGLELWDLSQGRQRHRALATPSKVSVIDETALGQHRRQGCQGSPDPTASPMERRPCRSICPYKPSRIRGTKSGP